MVESSVEKITAALIAHGSIRKGSNWTCPVHDDSKPSLTVSVKNVGSPGATIHCQANCSEKDVVSALGLKMNDLFDSQVRERREKERYPYTDVDGTVLFSKTRFDPKDFLIFHPTETGWAPGKGDAKPVLYRLPELCEAISKGETVYIVEGEKDVNTMRVRGLTATCNYEGAGKWRDSYSKYFADADVIVIADRDDAGYKHAKEVRDSLKGVTRSVRVMQAAVNIPKADISDHFAAGYDVGDLVPLRGAFKPVSLGKLVEKGVIAPQRIADGMLYAGGLHCIAGAPDCGKTTIGLHWAVRLLTEGKRVAFFDEEGGQEIVAEKLIALGAKVPDMKNLVYVPFPGKMWDDSDVAELIEFLDEIRPAMALWDSSAAFLARAGLDENSASAVTNWWARVLTPLARELGAAVLVIDHDTKSSEQSRYARGSGAKLAALDVQFKVEIQQPFTRDQPGRLKLIVSKDRRGYLHREWIVQVNTGSILDLNFMHETEENYFGSWAPAKRKIWGVLQKDPLSIVQIQEQLAELFPDEKVLSRETCSTTLNGLVEEGRARSSGGIRGNQKVWRREPRYL